MKRNDVILEPMAKFGPSQSEANFYIIQNVLIRAIQKCIFLLNFSYCVKIYGHLCQILSLFTMTIHEIWSCQVTQFANFDTLA